MLKYTGKPLLLIILIFSFIKPVSAQYQDSLLLKHHQLKLRPDQPAFFSGYSKTKAVNSTLPLAIGVVALVYLFNPIFVYENDRINGGITKEISVGFGYFGEYRLGFEYSYIFRANQSSHFRISGKYDYLLSDLKPSNMFQSTSVLSFGAGLYTDFDGSGVFPEVSYGY